MLCYRHECLADPCLQTADLLYFQLCLVNLLSQLLQEIVLNRAHLVNTVSHHLNLRVEPLEL